ncbi:MAG: DNA repair protein RecO [Planctomycetes bacterium]|nr:DNA repair protein RecO [Planctomycetota bacterium]
MPPVADTAVVLTRVDYSETSQVLVFFTRGHGKVRAIAKGAKRSTKTRFMPGIDLLESGRLVFSTRQERSETLATLTEWKQTAGLPGLRERLDRLYAAQYVAEVTAHLTEDWDPHPGLFDALAAVLAELNRSQTVLPAVVEFQAALLMEVGSWPRFDACVSCGRVGDLTYFSSFEGGMICRHCEPGRVEKYELAAPGLDWLRAVEGAVHSRVAAPAEDAFETAETPPSFPAPPPRSVAGAPARGPQGGGGDAGHQPGGGATPSREPMPVCAAFGVLNYHISHLMGRAPLLAARLLPRAPRRPRS